MPPDPIRYRENFQAETDAAAIYDALADLEKQPTLAEVYRRMAASEHRHAKFWAGQLRDAGQDPGNGRPTWRARALIWAARRFGAQYVLPTLAANENVAGGGYTGQPEV